MLAHSDASEDLKYLLDRGYAKKAALILVSTRYGLDVREKNFLQRFVYSEKDILAHKEKLKPIGDIRGRDIVVDGYNVLITVESVMSGQDLVFSMDGFLRDFAGVFSKYEFSDKTKKALNLIFTLLKEEKPRFTLFIFDSQISKSGELAAYVRRKLREKGLRGDARTSRSADKEIIETGCITASSDGIIVEKVEDAVDLPAEACGLIRKS